MPTLPASRFPLTSRSILPALRALERLWAMGSLWASRRRQRRALAKLDDRLLADIGVTRRQADRECRKPFWR